MAIVLPRKFIKHVCDLLHFSERKLAKAKGTPGELSSRDMVKSLSSVKDDVMRRLTENTSLNSDEPETDKTLNNSGLGADIMRKLYPEKQAITAEELHVLTKNDQLEKTTEVLNS